MGRLRESRALALIELHVIEDVYELFEMEEGLGKILHLSLALNRHNLSLFGRLHSSFLLTFFSLKNEPRSSLFVFVLFCGLHSFEYGTHAHEMAIWGYFEFEGAIEPDRVRMDPFSLRAGVIQTDVDRGTAVLDGD